MSESYVKLAAKRLGAVAVSLVLINLMYHHYNHLLSNDSAPLDAVEQKREVVTLPYVEEPKCEPRKNIVYLKTHKCASSTLQRVFLRYGKEHNLSFALPGNSNYLGWVLPFRAKMIPPSLRTPSGKYNMFILHTRFSKDAIAQVMPKDSAWVTIIREPLDQFESMWTYYGLGQFYKMDIDAFAKLPYKKVAKWRKSRLYGVHQMMFDLGFGSIGEDTPDERQKMFSQLNSTFDLVMIAERFDESLVLLKHLMCWTTEDMVYLSINARKDLVKKTLTNGTRERLSSLDKPDFELYEFFTKFFDQKVKAFGEERMKREVEELHEANKQIQEKCVVKDERVSGNTKWRKDLVSLAVKEELQECVDLVKTEISFVDEMRKNQRLWIKNGWPVNKTNGDIGPLK